MVRGCGGFANGNSSRETAGVVSGSFSCKLSPCSDRISFVRGAREPEIDGDLLRLQLFEQYAPGVKEGPRQATGCEGRGGLPTSSAVLFRAGFFILVTGPRA